MPLKKNYRNTKLSERSSAYMLHSDDIILCDLGFNENMIKMRLQMYKFNLLWGMRTQ